MSKEIYISWVKGLPQDKGALRYLKDSGIVSGVAMSNIDEQVEMVLDAGLKFSSHTPGMALTLNLADPDYIKNSFGSEQGSRLSEVIRMANAPTVDFHLGYSAEQVYKMIAYPNVPVGGTLIVNEGMLADRITNNIVALERKVNEGLPDDRQVQIALETLDHSRESPIPWDKQYEDALANREEIEETVRGYGINAGILFVTNPDFVKTVLDGAGRQNIKPVGFLFDIGHNFISADAKIHKGEFTGTIGDYFDKMLKASNGRTHHLHLTVPEGSDKTGYADHHHPFTEGEALSDRIITLSQEVVRVSPELKAITLEMRTDLEPEDHAKKMVEQAEYVTKKLNL